MSDLQQDKPQAEEADAAPGPESVDIHAIVRRRLIKGAAVTPVLMSLASRPVMGAARQCAPSGFMSGNTSPQAGEDTTCGGYSPGYWKNPALRSSWPSPYSPTTQFHSVFTSKAKYDYGTKDMLWVLYNKPGSFAFHAIAALLNAASQLADYSLTTTEVIKIWNDISTLGYYLTSTGKKMYEADAKQFFENTYH